MSVSVPLLSSHQVGQLPERAREVVEYRKSGLSLNHIQGCPLDCAYCIRHTYGLWDQRVPRALMSTFKAARRLTLTLLLKSGSRSAFPCANSCSSDTKARSSTLES